MNLTANIKVGPAYLEEVYEAIKAAGLTPKIVQEAIRKDFNSFNGPDLPDWSMTQQEIAQAAEFMCQLRVYAEDKNVKHEIDSVLKNQKE